ncbi:unnamed protein product, partial [Brenthis ino]
MYCTWKLDQLKEELRRRGESFNGKKADLVERLEAYDGNFNFAGKSDTPEPQQVMVIPNDEYYKDINDNTPLPPLQKDQVQQYFEGCNQALVKGKSLYENRYLRLLRAVTIKDFIFVKGICKATMKNTQYEVNIKLHKNGALQETHCECTVESGVRALCKHVATALLATVHMNQNKTVLLEEVPTRTLQTSHHPKKKYFSLPLKAQSLPYKGMKENYDFHPFKGKINQEKYNERIRNLVLSYTDSTMPLKQLYKPANLNAVGSDHGSYNVSPKNAILESLCLKKVTTEDVNIEKDK